MSKYGIRLTIPDAPPKEQIKMIERVENILRLFAKAIGEDIEADLKPLQDAKTRLKAPQGKKEDSEK